MAKYLIDSNVLLRSLHTGSEQRRQAMRAVIHLLTEGDTVCITPQVMIEFWAVATRPPAVNGFGLAPSFTAFQLGRWMNRFVMLEDNRDVFSNWLVLVKKYEIKGKKTHDARLAAVMLSYGVENMLTFNVSDFAQYSEIKAVHPAEVGQET